MLEAGAALGDISPRDSQFLFGYPHVERYSAGIHDPLLTAALCLRNGGKCLLFSANDIIFIPKASAARIRAQVSAATGLRGDDILVSATHTHSGPITVDYLSGEADPILPRCDPGYLGLMEETIAKTCVAAFSRLEPAKAGLAVADATGVGTNRRDPTGPSDPQVPVLSVRSLDDRAIACMLVYSMHPTVLHEDSRLVSADFPWAAREHLGPLLGEGCVILYHTGPEGNQSPRHVTKANDFAEARRLGVMLGAAVERALPAIEYSRDLKLESSRVLIDLPRREFPTVEEAQAHLDLARQRFSDLKEAGKPKNLVRTAECDLFGAEETLTLSRAARDWRIGEAYGSCLPAEIQVFGIGPWRFVAWPGEVFIEYSLAVKRGRPGTFVINLANGEFQGYIVTEEAAREGGYEASNALFDPRAGEALVRATARLLDQQPAP